MCYLLRPENSMTFIKFCIVGTSGVFVNLSIFTILTEFELNKFIASPISIEVSVFSNFLLNNSWTFRHRNTKDNIRLKGLKFNIVNLLALGVSYLTFITLSCLFPAFMPQIPQAIGIIPGTFVNYFLNSYWTFKEEDNYIESR